MWLYVRPVDAIVAPDPCSILVPVIEGKSRALAVVMATAGDVFTFDEHWFSVVRIPSLESLEQRTIKITIQVPKNSVDV